MVHLELNAILSFKKSSVVSFDNLNWQDVPLKIARKTEAAQVHWFWEF